VVAAPPVEHLPRCREPGDRAVGLSSSPSRISSKTYSSPLVGASRGSRRPRARADAPLLPRGGAGRRPRSQAPQSRGTSRAATSVQRIERPTVPTRHSSDGGGVPTPVIIVRGRSVAPLTHPREGHDAPLDLARPCSPPARFRLLSARRRQGNAEDGDLGFDGATPSSPSRMTEGKFPTGGACAPRHPSHRCARPSPRRRRSPGRPSPPASTRSASSTSSPRRQQLQARCRWCSGRAALPSKRTPGRRPRPRVLRSSSLRRAAPFRVRPRWRWSPGVVVAALVCRRRRRQVAAREPPGGA
jgi:hypothetical protein